MFIIIITLSLFVNFVSMDIYKDGADVMQGEGARCKAKDILTIENDSGFGLNRLIW